MFESLRTEGSLGTMKKIFLLVCLLIVCQMSASAVEYYCVAFKKVDSDREYLKNELRKSQFATKLEDLGSEAYLSRCSYSLSEKEVTCDRYKVDKIEYDSIAKIKKYYVFRNQFNFQLFPNLVGIEDNGRGSVQFSKCKVLVP